MSKECTCLRRRMANGLQRPLFGRRVHGIWSFDMRSLNDAGYWSLHDDSGTARRDVGCETRNVVRGCGCYESWRLWNSHSNLSFALPPADFNVACITAMACSTSHTHAVALHQSILSRTASNCTLYQSTTGTGQPTQPWTSHEEYTSIGE